MVTCYTGVSVRRNLYVKLQTVASEKMLILFFCVCIFHMSGLAPGEVFCVASKNFGFECSL